MAIYLKHLLTEKLSKSKMTGEKRSLGGEKQFKTRRGKKHFNTLKTNYSINLMQMLLWRKINSGETIVFTKIILLRESALERAKCFFLFINYK